MRQYRAKNREKILAQQRSYQANYELRKKAERKKFLSLIQKGMANEKDENGIYHKIWRESLKYKGKKLDIPSTVMRTFHSISNFAGLNQELNDFTKNMETITHLAPTLQVLEHERRQVELRNFKRKLMEKYVHGDPDYEKLTQEGQVYYEQSFLAFLDFLEKTKNLELLRRKEDLTIIEKIDVFHLKQAKEIMAELDKFLKKKQAKVEKAARDARKLEDS
jgi:hypothetical protein